MMTHRPTSGGVALLRRAWLTLLLLVATSWTQAQLSSGTSTSATSPTSTSAPQATCGPSGTGQTACGGDGVASQNLNEVDAGAGNPIHLITGNKYQREVDLPALPGVLGLEIVRHYNSQFSRLSTPNGIVGRGWKLSYETRLYPGGVSLQVVQADGARIIFSRDPLHPSVCTTSDPSQGQIKVIKSPQGRRYEWIWPSGKVLSFNAQGRLTQILAPTGEFVSLQYSSTGLLVSVTDPQNRSLRLNYLDSREAAKREKFTGVVSIDTPVGRFAYEYGSTKPQGSQITDRELRANLVKVNLPTHYNPDEQAHPLTQRGTTSSTLSRLYHYEDARWPTLLTGISVQATGQAGQLSRQRLATWGYDVNGQGILSEYPGTGGHRLQFDRSQPGQTVITDAQGRQTTYIHAIVQGHYRLLESRGAGCTPCSPANQRYRYDSQARLTHQIDLNAQGQAVRGWRFYPDHQGRTLATAMLVFDTQGQAREHIVEQRQYQGDSPWPAVVRTPSVVQGRWREQRWSYNAQGQPTRVVQTGWVPALPQGAAGTGGTVEPQPIQPLKREVSYSYQRINNRSVLVAVDGPLPGTADTRRYVWDKRGDFVSTEELPGKLRRSVERDPAGRVVTSTDVDAVPVRLRYTPMGQALHWQRGEAQVKLTLDAQERPTRIELPDGEVQLLAYGGPQGQGSALAMSSNAGWARWLARPEPGAMPASAPSHVAAPESAQAPPWTDEQLIFDDFGRLVAMHTQTTGWELRSYDAGNQIVARHTSDGTDWRWQRDALGRITRHVVSRPGQAEQVTTLRYRGPWLIDVVHPHESEHLSYDALGRMSTRTVRRQHLSYTERLAYDAADRVTRHDLPEGGSLRYAWGVGRVLHAIEHDNGTITALLGEPVSQWLGWGRRTIIEPLPSQPMATTAAASSAASAGSSPQARLQAAAMAQRGYRWGNGVELRWHLDERGQLAALRYVGAPRPMAWLDAWLPNAQAANEPSLIDLSYDYDAWGRMSTRTQDGVRTQFGYDALGRLLLAQPGDAAAQPDTPVEYYAYAQGRLMASQVQGRNHDWRQIKTERSPSGLPSRIESSQGIRGLSYSADNRLIEVSQGAQVLAHYAHNTHGQRIRKTVGTQLSTDYLWHQGQLVGETLAQQMPQTRQTTARVEERLARRYVYAHGVPVAVLDYSEGAALDAQANDEDAGSWPEVRQWARALWRALTTDAPELSYVHANEIGAPVAVTNAQGQVLWRASYSAFGQLDPVRPQGVAKPFVLNLRLPGQYFDAETGWHDNGLRTYDPQRGEYLEPDPLGPLPNRASGRLLTQPYAYANHNPLIYADPSGLILFAFDGTENTDDSFDITRRERAELGNGLSNVVRFRDVYNDGERNYVSGVGTTHVDERYGDIERIGFDAAVNRTGTRRIDRMLVYLMEAADAERNDRNPLMIDIIGFSRGAAQARDFANQVVSMTRNGVFQYNRAVENEQLGQTVLLSGSQRVCFRFMGLWDTVLSTNSGRDYALGIPSEFRYVAHAVALNEYRSEPEHFWQLPGFFNGTRTHLSGDKHWGGFPLESIGASSNTPGRVRIERGFIGAHADIGGGYAETEGQLSQVALNWMVAQAQLAGVRMLGVPNIQMDNPVIHDPSNALRWGNPTTARPVQIANGDTITPEDREVRGAVGGNTQRSMRFNNNSMTNADTHRFIRYWERDPSPRPRQDTNDIVDIVNLRNRTGSVDMAGYMQWLRGNGYCFSGDACARASQ